MLTPRCLLTFCAVFTGAPLFAFETTVDDDVPSVNSPRLHIDYQLAAGSGRVTGAEVWYTLDEGRTWKPGEVEFHADGPLLFTTPDEGLHGLFVIVRNGVAASAPPPSTGTKPQLRVFVDHTPPVVQIVSVVVDTASARRTLTIGYAAYDPHLLPRPISVEYRLESEKTYRPIAAHVPNTGIFEWTPPAGMHSGIRVRVLAEDRGGQTASAESNVIELNAAALPGTVKEETTAIKVKAERTKPRMEGEPPARLAGLDAPVDDALAVTLREARLRQSRGEWQQAEQRFREVLARDAGRSDVHAALAGVLYHQGRLAEAEQEYRRLLRAEPKHAAGMAGLAMVLAARRDYPAARDVLTTLSNLRSGDPGVLLDLGDMQMLAGDRAAGRAAWLRAKGLAELKPAMREQLDRRLLIYPEQDVP